MYKFILFLLQNTTGLSVPIEGATVNRWHNAMRFKGEVDVQTIR
jgi:hypothetical protein